MGRLVAISATVVLALVLFAGVSAAEVRSLSPQRVNQLVREASGLWLIDVRSPAAFARGHIEGAINLPEESLEVRQFPRRKFLVLIDNSLGNVQARRAGQRMVERGQEKVFFVAGGLRGWRRAGLPMIGHGEFWEMARVMPGEFEQARQAGVPLDVYDLRSPTERQMGPIDGATIFDGMDFNHRLLAVCKLLTEPKSGKFLQMAAPGPAVVVLPTRISAIDVYRQYFWNLDYDIRILEGAFVLASSTRQQRVATTGDCASCPGEQ